MRPISLLVLSLLRLIDSQFLGNALWTLALIDIPLESNPLKSRVSAWRSAVARALPKVAEAALWEQQQLRAEMDGQPRTKPELHK